MMCLYESEYTEGYVSRCMTAMWLMWWVKNKEKEKKVEGIQENYLFWRSEWGKLQIGLAGRIFNNQAIGQVIVAFWHVGHISRK